MRLYKNQYFPSDVGMPISAPDELQNPNILHINRLSPRATIIPSDKAQTYYYNKEKSSRIFSLNGDYRFAYFSDEAPNGFEAVNFDDSDWDILDVPSMWQYRGYGEPTYPNVRYPFPFAPPHILRLNPFGCYRREFTLDKSQMSDRAILHFEGVDNAFYVYINGSFVGFSKGSRLPAEFDITNLLKDGKNTIAVKVYTYSDATYLENQDMLMANGIFRDVYIIFCPKVALWDWEIITNTTTLSLDITLFEDVKNTKARITFNNNTITLPIENGKCHYEVSPENVKLWSAEEPNLYDLTVEILENDTVCEIHSKRVGFVFSEVVGREFRVNGKKVILRGINRHENNAKNGRALTVEQVRADLELIKNHNINAIRCSHYPNNAAFYEFASELGIYVMDEGDLESHGSSATGDQGFLNKSPEWLNAFMDRTVRMAERDKNETCVVMWSVGNEIGVGQNADKCAEYLHSRKDKKPVQWHATDKTKQDFLYSGYPSLMKMELFTQDERDSGKPLCLLEYAHAMGNSPGNLQNLWDYIIDHPEYMGGYVWEFRSHGFEKINDDGTVDYLYGGDFHDTNHWTNFTLDGYCRSDGTPKPTFLELKYVFAPIRLDYENGKLRIHNIQSFLSTEGMLLETEVFCDGKIVSKKVEPMPKVEPMQMLTVDLITEYNGYDCFLNMRVIKSDDIIALKQFTLPATTKKAPLKALRINATVTQNADKISVTGENFEIAFANGLLNLYRKNGKTYIDSPMKIMTYRAETDNDGIAGVFPRWIHEWEEARLHKMQFYSFENSVAQKENCITVTSSGRMTYDYVYSGFYVDLVYSIYNDSLITTDMTVKPYGKMPCTVRDELARGVVDDYTPRLPRFGVCFKLSKEFDTVKWFGRGVDQNYDDTVGAAPVGIYELPLSQMNFEFDVPQETGNRGDTRYVQVADKSSSFTVYGNDCFAFSYHPWKLDDLRTARHKSELKQDKANYLYIDYKMRALGSHSCGPNPEQWLDFEPHDFKFVFAINGEQISDSPEYFLTELGEKTKKLTELYTYTPLESEREAVECNEE